MALLPPKEMYSGMKRYKKINPDAGIYAYKIGAEYILVEFNDGKIYRYTYRSAGKQTIEQMKILAAAGKGLTTYINKNVKEKYDEKIG